MKFDDENDLQRSATVIINRGICLTFPNFNSVLTFFRAFKVNIPFFFSDDLHAAPV